jgi:hypothetical protein
MKYLQELNPFTKDSQSDFLYIKQPIIIGLNDNEYKKCSLNGSRLSLILSETSEKPYYLSPKIDEVIRKALTKNNVIKGKYHLIEIYSMNLTVIGEIEAIYSNQNQTIYYNFDTEKKDYYIIEVDDNEKLIESKDKEYISKLYNENKKYLKYKKDIDNLDIEQYINSMVQRDLTRDGIFRPDANLIFYEAELFEWGKPHYKRYKLDK